MAFVFEGFEGLIATPNNPISTYGDGFWQPGFNSVFEFSSGLQLLGPIPNAATDIEGGAVLVGDFSVGNASWDVGSQGIIEGAGDVADGSAYLTRDAFDATITLGFDTDVFFFSAAVDALDGIGFAAYDINGKLIAGSRVNSVPLPGWGENFVGVISPKPIAKIVITGDYVVVDQIAFDTAAAGVNVLIKGSKRNDNLTKETSDGAELILGKKGNDKVDAKGGFDTVFGDAGNDQLHGGAGNDELNGGRGKDKLWGDDDQDSFILDDRSSVDRIKDFDIFDDTIVVSRKIAPGIAAGMLSQSSFSDGSGPITTTTRIIYDQAAGRLLYDGDGNGSDKAILFAKIQPSLSLTAEDFFVV